MTHTLSIASTLALIVALAASPVGASGIKSQLTDQQLADFCGTAGVGTHTEASIPMTDGSTLVGTIHCESEDLIVGSDDALDTPDSIDDDDHAVTSDDDSVDEVDDGSDDQESDDHGDDSSDDSGSDDDSDENEGSDD